MLRGCLSVGANVAGHEGTHRKKRMGIQLRRQNMIALDV